MDWIAQHWWLWLSILVLILAFVGIRSVTGLIGLARDTKELAGKLHRTTQLPPEERRGHLTNVGLEVVSDKLKKRAVAMIVNAGLIAIGGVSGVLLAIAVAHRFMN